MGHEKMSVQQNTPDRSYRLLWLAIVLVLAATGLRAWRVLHTHGQLRDASGVWCGLAVDYAHGTLYRPIVSDLGYGGTRYFPLYFILHGELIKRGMDVLNAGYAVSAASMVLLIAGAFFLQRRFGVASALAAAMALLILCSISSQIAATTIRGDLLPAALSIMGVILCAGIERGQVQTPPSAEPEVDAAAPPAIEPPSLGLATIIFAAVLFGLAIFAKITTVAGLGAVGLYLILHRRFGQAILLGVLSAVVAGGLLVTINMLSHGRFRESFAACASGGGGMASVKNMPYRLIWVIIDRDGPALIVLALALGALLLIPLQRWRELPSLLLIVTAICTAVIFFTPGIDRNHMTELHVAALVFLAVQITRGRIDGATVRAALAATAIFGAWYFALGMKIEDAERLKEGYVKAYHAAAPLGGPLLSDDTIAGPFVGQRTYLTDEFMFGVMGKKDPAIRKKLYDDMRRAYFAAIIFQREPDAVADLMGLEFLTLLNEHYEPVEDKHLYVYRPKSPRQQ
jgi:hypothetical protein